MEEKLKYILILAFVLNCAFVLSNFQNRTYDSFEHIFFADHYRTSWFNTWETKWYGGFTVTSYPPLAHQTIAVLSFVTGLEWAYKILTLALMTIFPLAVYKFSKIFVKENAPLYAAFISIFLPSVFQATYSFGQFPTIFALVAALFTIVYLNKFMISGYRLKLIIALGLLGVAVSAHHFTAIFLIPALSIIMIINFLLRRDEISLKILLRRTLLFSVCGILLCLVIIFPFWHFELYNSVGMTPIMHLSRADILFDSLGFELFFWNMYGSILFLIPFFLFLTLKNRRLFPLLLGAIFLLILGLGGTTPLPKLIFGQSWEILTYDRFSLWAGVMFLPLCGLLFAEYQNKFKIQKLYKKILAVFFVILILTAIYAADRNLIVFGGPSISSIDPAIEFLNDPIVQHWRYLTVGLGESAMLKLSVYANASNVDGYYFFVRSDPILSNSGIGMLDTAKYFGEKGMTILGEVLSNASKYSLRWVICGDPTYYKILLNNGFVERWSQDNTGDSRFGGVTIWECNKLPPEYAPNTSPEGKSLIDDYMWAIGPPLILFITILLLIIEKIKKDKVTNYHETLENLEVKKR
jgi:hypothetical protein